MEKYFDNKIYKTYPKLGYGTCPLGGITLMGKQNIGMGPQSLNLSKKCLIHAYDKGIRFYDTADIYGNGKVEKLLGKVFSKKKDISICTKFGNRVKGNKIIFDSSVNYFTNSLNLSLKRLKREYIDIFLLHSPPEKINIDLTLEKKINQTLQSGEISSFGVSCRSCDDAIYYINNYEFIKHIEINYNIFDRRAEKKLFKLARKNNISIIARAPFANGMVFTKNLKKKFKNIDFRSKFDSDTKNWLKKKIQNLNEKNKSFLKLYSIALRFCISNEYISVVIPGMRSIKQINDNVRYLKLGKISNKEIEKINNKIPSTYNKWK